MHNNIRQAKEHAKLARSDKLSHEISAYVHARSISTVKFSLGTICLFTSLIASVSFFDCRPRLPRQQPTLCDQVCVHKKLDRMSITEADAYAVLGLTAGQAYTDTEIRKVSPRPCALNSCVAGTLIAQWTLMFGPRVRPLQSSAPLQVLSGHSAHRSEWPCFHSVSVLSLHSRGKQLLPDS